MLGPGCILNYGLQGSCGVCLHELRDLAAADNVRPGFETATRALAAGAASPARPTPSPAVRPAPAGLRGGAAGTGQRPAPDLPSTCPRWAARGCGGECWCGPVL